MARPEIAVITAAIGHPLFGRCLASVQNQSFSDIEHYVVIDGPEHAGAVDADLAKVQGGPVPVYRVLLPRATGGNGWCSHRIYGGFSFLTHAPFVAFLDHDNELAPDHFATLVSAIRATDSAWAFALRNICDQQGTFVCRDECQSLGSLHPMWDDPSNHFIDTNCYLLRNDLAVASAPFWNLRRHGDRSFAAFLMSEAPPGVATRRYTLNYAAGSRTASATLDYFCRGNRAMRERYPQGLPWENGDMGA